MANPPIIIGPFDNVPAPGSPIRSDWPQEISQYLVDTVALYKPIWDGATDVDLHANGGAYEMAAGVQRLVIQGAEVVATTNSAGAVSVTFPIPYSIMAPLVNVIGGDPNTPIRCDLGSIYSSSFGFVARSGATGAVIVNGPIRFHWQAFGAAPPG